MNVQCFPGIKTEQLHTVLERMGLGTPETVMIHFGTNDTRTRNLDFVKGKECALMATAKSKLQNCRLVLSGVLRHRDMSWRRIGVLRFYWVANALGLTFVDPNSRIENGVSLKMDCI
jgi:hypothetical protein